MTDRKYDRETRAVITDHIGLQVACMLAGRCDRVTGCTVVHLMFQVMCGPGVDTT